ncbi:prepilin-type N-terminal cleavage/methylation domain-containing protein [Bacillus sp. JJ1521]|uniref:PulJ/GspJ family protein n=1 Tax=Bacillus sp. JJ1521 TaxID=3122957 RepID=UPI002FFDFAB5
MNKHLRNNGGITLIELLATLAIFSMVSILIYGVLINGMNYSEKSKDNVSRQQEMNILVTTITKAHESYSSYEIVVDQNPDANKIQLIGKDGSGTVVSAVDLSNEHYIYSLYNSQESDEVPFSNATTIHTSQPLYIKLIIKDRKQPSQKSEIKTIISRL